MIQKILKGDTSGQIALALADGFDYSGATVEFRYQGAVRIFKDCVAGQTVQFNLTAQETAPMALGAFPVEVRLCTADGGFYTVTNAGVKIEVTDCVADVREGGVIIVDAKSGLYGVDDLPARYTTADIRAKINEIIRHLGGGVSALCLAVCMAFGSAFGAGVTVTKTNLEEIHNDDKVVTGVTFDASGLATKADLEQAAAKKDGAARILPKYLWCRDFFDSYADDAAWYYAMADMGGACSSVRDGNAYSRNFDFPYDERAEFVVRMAAGPDRFASVGVANVGTNLTEGIVTSGKPSRFFKCLPGATVDGINERGVAANINVVPANGAEGTVWPGHEINALGAVRWVLDRATSAGMAASNLAAKAYIPDALIRKGYSAHFMVADERETWIVEDGAAHKADGRAVLTNYRLYVPDDPFGTGFERYALLADGGNITSAWFRAAYRRPFTRPTEFAAPGVGTHTETDALAAWADANIPQGAPESLTRNGKSWQTVHCSVYDLSNRVLRVAVQETPDWYVFGIPASGGGDGKVKSVNGKDGEVVLTAADVHALPSDNSQSLIDNPNFTNAVLSVSPIAPNKIAMSNITNANGNAVNAKDVNALPDGTTIWEMSQAKLGEKWSESLCVEKVFNPSVAYGNGFFLGISGNEMGNEPYSDLMKSSDGCHWSMTRVSVSLSVIADIAFGNGVFVIPTSDGIYCTTDGVSVVMSDCTEKRTLVAFGNGMFVAAGEKRGIIKSSDGLHWENVSEYSDRKMAGLGYVNGMFVLSFYDQNSKIITSQNLTSWNVINSDNTAYGVIAYNDGVYVSAHSPSPHNGGVQYSTNLGNWTIVNIGHHGSFLAIYFRLGKFYAMGSFYNSGALMNECAGLWMSSDGMNWNKTNLSDIDYLYGKFNGMATDGKILVSAYMNYISDQKFVYSRSEPVVQTITVNGCVLPADADNNVTLPPIPDKIAVSSVTNAQGNSFTADDINAVPTTRKINGQPLTGDINIEAMPGNGVMLTNGALQTKGGTAITAGNVGAATPGEVQTAISSSGHQTAEQVQTAIENAGHATTAELEPIAYAANQAAIYASGTYQYMHGNTNAWFEGTNYNVNAEQAAQKTKFAFEDGMDLVTMPCSMALREIREGQKQVVWDQRDWTVWYWNFKSGQMRTDLQAQIAGLSENVRTNYMTRGWAKYTAVQGLDNPATDTLWIDTPKVSLMAGKQWEKLIEVGGAGYYTLTGNGIELAPQDAESTFLTIKDFEGNACLTFRKTSSYLVYCECGTDITRNFHDAQGRVVFHLTTDVQPTAEFSTILDTASFIEQGEEGCPANYEWTGSAGNWDCHFLLKPGISSDACFARFKVMREGENVVEHTVPIKINGGIAFDQDGVTRKIRPTISGNTVNWVVVQ